MEPSQAGVASQVLQYVTIVGAGRVGVLTAALLASKKPSVHFTIVDIDLLKIDKWSLGIGSFRESWSPSDLLKRENIDFSREMKLNIKKADLVLVCVPLPGTAEDVWRLLQPIARIVRPTSTLVVRSTTSPGALFECWQTHMVKPGSRYPSDLLCNPEFMASGLSLGELDTPSKVVLGTSVGAYDTRSMFMLQSLYSGWVDKERVHVTDLTTAEMIKLGANVMRAQRVIGMNVLHMYGDLLNVDMAKVQNLVDSDPRLMIPVQNIRTGLGGPCLQGNLDTFLKTSEQFRLPYLEAYWKSNQQTDSQLGTEIINGILAQLSANLKPFDRVIVAGYAFKPGTDEIRGFTEDSNFSSRLVTRLLQAKFNVSLIDQVCSGAAMDRELSRLLRLPNEAGQLGLGFDIHTSSHGASSLILNHGQQTECMGKGLD